MLFSTYSHTSHRVRFSGCLMLFSTYSHTFKRCKIQWLFVSCRGSGFCDLFQLFASFAQLTVRPLTSCEPHSWQLQPGFVSASRHRLGSTSTSRVLTMQFLQHRIRSPPDFGRSSRQLAPATGRVRLALPESGNFLQLRVIFLCDRYKISQGHIWNLDETVVRMVPSGERGWTKKGESAHVFASRAFVTVTLAANMRGVMLTTLSASARDPLSDALDHEGRSPGHDRRD